MSSRKLGFENFDGLKSNHGLDVIADPERQDAVYIFAVHHPPSPQYLAAFLNKEPFKGEKERPLVEVFHHVLGASSVRHVRTIEHTGIYRPNDIIALGPTSFYVTNDHAYADGWPRYLENIVTRAKWTDVSRVEISELSPESTPTSGVTTIVALDKLHTANGLGRGSRVGELIVATTVSGILHIIDIQPNGSLAIQDSIALDSTLDNPTYFTDPFPSVGRDASGYVLSGLAKAKELVKHLRDPLAKDPALVWFVRKSVSGTWEKSLLFEDDGSRVRGASTALLVGIDPITEGGKKKAWLFATGFWSERIIAVKVDL
jgi:hypothetical protein